MIDFAVHQGWSSALLFSLGAEILVSAMGQISISYRFAAICLLLSMIFNGICIAAAFGSLDSIISFDFWFVFATQLGAGILQIPVNQLAARFQVKEKLSQARFRMYAWIAVISAGTLPLVRRTIGIGGTFI